MLYMLEQFFAERGGLIDFLRGAEPYKDTWTERSVTNARIRAARSGLRASLGRLVWFELMPKLQLQAPFLYRFLLVASEEGPKGIAARVLQRLVRTG